MLLVLSPILRPHRSHRCPSVQASEQARGNPTAELLTFLETLRRGAKIDVVRHTTTTLHQA